MECRVLLLYLPPKYYWRKFALSPPSFVQIPFITWAFAGAYFRPGLGDKGLTKDILEGRGGAHWGATAGSRCFSGLLAPHQDYCRLEARGQDNRLRPDNLFIPYRENIIREEVSCFSEPQTFSCWTWRFSYTSAWFIGRKVYSIVCCRLHLRIDDILIGARRE